MDFYNLLDSVCIDNGKRFHFVMDEVLFYRLNVLSEHFSVSMSKLIHVIFLFCDNFIEKGDFVVPYGDDRDFKERDLSMCKDMKITISSEFKKQLFMIQDHFCLRSKAEVLRHVIRKFFEKLDKFGGKIFDMVRKRFEKIWEKEKSKNRVWHKGKQIKKSGHMSNFQIAYSSFIYDSHHNLTKVRYLFDTSPK